MDFLAKKRTFSEASSDDLNEPKLIEISDYDYVYTYSNIEDTP